MFTTVLSITFTGFPPVSESVKAQEPYYWESLELHHSYKVVSDYEKLKSNGQYEHFLLIINKDHNLIEVPVRNNIKVNYIA